MAFGIGQAIKRKEDQRFLTGHGRYTDDINLSNQAHLVLLRSPHAHARITHIDTTEAKNAPGVIAVFTGQDLADDGIGPLTSMIPFKNRDGSDAKNAERHLLQPQIVRMVGDPVAAIIAETPQAGKDASELIEVDYEALDAVVTAEAAAEPDAPQVWGHAPGNVMADWEMGDDDAVQAAIDSAAHVVRLKLENNRVSATPMEPRAALATYESGEGTYELHTNTQGSHFVRNIIAGTVLKVDPAHLRVVTPDVGGGFGLKFPPFAEQAMCLYAARKVGRPIKWCSERSEGFLADSHGRDLTTDAALALDKEGHILALRLETKFNLGAYLTPFGVAIQTVAPAGVVGGPYKVPVLYDRATGYFTNTTSLDAYRGAGRPEACYMIERLMDVAAREIGLGQDEIRRRNFFSMADGPYKTAAGTTFDSGDFAATMDMALKEARWDGFETRKADSAARGKLRGRGLAYYCELTLGNPDETAEYRFTEDGKLRIGVGTLSTGQGHETAFAQIASEVLGVPLEKIEIVQGDTALIKVGHGTGGSRSTQLAGSAIYEGAKAVIEKGKKTASEMLEAAEADIDYADGQFVIAGTDRSADLFAVAAKAKEKAASEEEAGLDLDHKYSREASSFPNGCHICEVEIDPDTGVVDLLSYTVVDDFGVVMNPMLLAGQVHGGVAQGVGQALYEHIVYDPESGQLVTGSLQDYCIPKADNLPMIEFSYNVVPCKTNPLGMKGAGEAGTVGSLPAPINAVVDALWEPYGVTHIDMPATPERVWRAMQNTQAAIAAE